MLPSLLLADLQRVLHEVLVIGHGWSRWGLVPHLDPVVIAVVSFEY